MLDSAIIEAALRDALPPELHPHLAGIARILYAAASGALSAEVAEARLAAEPAFTPILRALARREAGNSSGLLTFGQDAQLGDIGINDIVGGNLLRLTVNNYYGGTPSEHGQTDEVAQLPGATAQAGMVYPGFVATDVRRRAFGPDGKPLGTSPVREAEVMSAEKCAALILRAAAARRREEVMTTRGKLGLWLKLIAPHLVDRIARQAIEEGR